MAGIGAASIYASIVSFSLLILGLYIVGIARYMTNFEDNTCEMTYMFEYPQYVRISLNDEVNERYPRFALYAYGEGFVTQKLRKMKFSGIPVLFVPGNSGSHEQARSLASVSLRKSIDDRTSFHFDYFTVSLGKDYSALYGGVLDDETSYVSLCIDKILSLYKGNVGKIVLIGHSMGGIVAKGVLLRRHSSDKREGESSASILLTMASPHKPIFLPDRTISRYYQDIENSRHLFAKMNTSIVSIGGGERDTLVGLSQTIDSNANINILTSGMPDVWRSTDHLCILWCKQLIISVVRALFDSVDQNAHPPTILSDSREKLRALSYHFNSRITGKRLYPYKEIYNFERGGQWIEDIRRQYTWTCSTSNDLSTCDKTSDVYLMIRLDSPSYDSLTIESINLEAKDWVFACSAHSIEAKSRVCEWGWNLTNVTSLSPDPMHRSRKKLRIDIKSLITKFKLSHIVVRIPSNELRAGKKSLVKIHVDLYRSNDRILHLQDPILTFFKIFRPSGILSPNPYGTLVTSRGSLTHDIFLAGINDAVSIEIEAIDSNNNDIEKPCAIFELVQQETSQVRAILFGGTEKKERMSMFLGGGDKEEGILRVSLGPEYSYRMIIGRGGIIDRVACSVRDRWPTIYPLIICLCLLGIATRIDGSPRKTSITCGITILLCLIYHCIFETIVAIGMIHVFAVTTCCLVIFFGAVANSIAARFLARIVALPNLWFDWILGGLIDRVPILTTFILLSLISATCGAIAILISVALFFLKFTRMYDEYVEGLLVSSFRRFNPFRRQNRGKRREPSTATDSTRSLGVQNILDTLLLFVTWTFAAVPAIPSALVWAKNFRYETRLTTEEPTMLLSWLVLTGWGSLGLVDITSSIVERSNNFFKFRRILCGTILRLISWFLLCTANFENSPHYQWMVPPLVAISVTCLSILSLSKPKLTTVQNEIDE